MFLILKIIYYSFIHFSVSNWIFVITSDYKEFEKRTNDKKWPIFSNTAHKKVLKVGDRILFYKGGADGQKFLGRANLASALKRLNDLNSYVMLSDIEVWKKQPSIRHMIPDLTFVVHKQMWGIHLQGGVITLFDRDYDYISSRSH